MKTLVLAVALVFGTVAAQASTLLLMPSSYTVDVGDPVDVDIVIVGLGFRSAPSLGAFDFDLAFDPTVLNPLGMPAVSFGTGLDLGIAGSIQGAAPTAPGVINMFEVSLESLFNLESNQADFFTLATVSFTALAPGASLLTLNNVVLADGIGDRMDALVMDARINVRDLAPAPVPLPASLPLLAVAFAGVIALGRRRKSIG